MSVLPIAVMLLFAVSGAGFAWYAAICRGEKTSPRAGGAGPVARWRESRRRSRFAEQLPDALATMSNALKAGFSIAQAFESVIELGNDPVSAEFAVLQKQLRIGMGMDEALDSLAQRTGSEDFQLVAAAILASRKTGGNITEIFEKIASTIRMRMKIQRKIKTLTAQGRLQGAVVSAMPLVLGAAMTALKPEMMIPFFNSMAGVAAIAATLVLTGAGWLLIRKITNIDI